jgi:phosphatidylserine decarboxylase
MDNAELGDCASCVVIDELDKYLQCDEELREALEESLRLAKQEATEILNHQLFEALEWPTENGAYLQFLRTFARFIPQPSMAPAWTSQRDLSGHQEIYDRLCHFYYLVSHGINHESPQQNAWFQRWLSRYADAWGSFLDTSQSFNSHVLTNFRQLDPRFEVDNSMISDDGVHFRPNNPSGWLTFNQFFGRGLNPGLRPITDKSNNATATCPADCTFREMYHIDENSCIQEIRIKKTHTFGNIPDLLGGSSLGGADFLHVFAGGSFAHYFLGPFSYHRFHAPVSGMVKACYAIKGLAYLEVHIKNEQFNAPDSAANGYEFTQARGVLILDTSNSPDGDVGLVAVIPVGTYRVIELFAVCVAVISVLLISYICRYVSGVICQHDSSSRIQLEQR